MPGSDLNNVWLDQGWWVQPNGTRRLLSWNAATHELKFWALDGRHDDTALDGRHNDMVLAVIPTEEEVVRRLAGWEAHNDTKEGLTWLAQQLEGRR